MMTIAQIMEKMIAFSEGNIHDITHLSCVWTYAKTIGELEGLDADTQFILEVAAITHDIACPLCREKYGDVNGKHQEIESPALVREFLKDFGCSQDFIDRIAFLIGHHHTPDGIDGIDYQILIEADYLVNAYEMNFNKKSITAMYDKFFRTSTGRAILKEMYGL